MAFRFFSLTIVPRQLSAFRRRQPDLLTLPTLSVNDVANLIAMEVEKRGYEGVGALDVWKYHEMPSLKHFGRSNGQTFSMISCLTW